MKEFYYKIKCSLIFFIGMQRSFYKNVHLVYTCEDISINIDVFVFKGDHNEEVSDEYRREMKELTDNIREKYSKP